MNNEPRGQHVHSHCYLKGFTENKKSDSPFNVLLLDKQELLINQNPSKFGKKRDFNRTNIQNVNPYAIELALADFEHVADKAIRNVEQTRTFVGEDRNTILTMAALFFIRNPLMRELHNTNINTMMKLSLEIYSNVPMGA